MTPDAYLNPDFTAPEKLLFFLLALAGVVICNVLIAGMTGAAGFIAGGSWDKEKRNSTILDLMQMFYEMMISATSVMSFACAYVIVNHVYSLVLSGGAADGNLMLFKEIWEKYRDFILLIMILCSCVLNTILDRLIIPLKRIRKEEIASIRMLAMFYAIIMLLCLNVYGDESEYGPVMMYYLGLMVGRFVYFDASFMDFLTAVKNVFIRSPLLLLGLTLSGLLCTAGFKAGFFLERNYYIVGVLHTHLFILAAVFVLHLSHIPQFIFRTGAAEDRDDD